MRWKFTIVLPIVGMILTGCVSLTDQAGAIDALCRTWGESLPTRSRQDTEQTVTEIAEGYADFLAACPGWERLVPGRQ